MYDIKEKIKALTLYLDTVKAGIEKNEFDGIVIITCKKDEWAEVHHALGDCSYFEWVGLLDYAKDVLQEWYENPDEE